MSREGVPLRLLVVPYDSGNLDARMGAGPLVLAPEAESRLRDTGHAVTVQRVDPPSTWRAEAQTAFELQREIAAAVRVALQKGEVPLLLSGNCNSTLGVLAGLQSQSQRVGLLWLDAHADFNTPETTATGFLDGQGLAMAVGRCWTRATHEVAGFTPLAEHDVLLIGARDLGEPEEAALRTSDVVWLEPAEARDPGMMDAALETLSGTVDVLHVHIDVDVHDPEDVAPGNSYAPEGGFTATEVQRVLRTAASRVPVVSATLASYEPRCDRERRMQRAALDLVETLARCSRHPSRTAGIRADRS